jgi:hypothetical protein
MKIIQERKQVKHHCYKQQFEETSGKKVDLCTKFYKKIGNCWCINIFINGLIRYKHYIYH